MSLNRQSTPRIANYPIIRSCKGEITNPDTSSILADTGEIKNSDGGSGTWEILIVASANAAAEFAVQHRNSTNTGTQGDVMIFYTPTSVPCAVPFRFDLQTGERIRVTMNTALTGDAVVSLTAQRVG